MSTLVPKKMFTTGMGPLSVEKTNTPDEARTDLMGIPGDMEKRNHRYIVAAPPDVPVGGPTRRRNELSYTKQRFHPGTEQ